MNTTTNGTVDESLCCKICTQYILWTSEIANTKGQLASWTRCWIINLMTHHFRSLCQRTVVLWVEWDEGCPSVYSTYERLANYLCTNNARYQMACNWSFKSALVDLSSMNFQAMSNSSVAPDSKPWESWKIKLLLGYVIWCSMSCIPLWQNLIYQAICLNFIV